MSFIANLFSPPKAKPGPLPPPPKIGDAASEAAARQQRINARKKGGVDSTFLAPAGSETGQAGVPLGNPSTGGAAPSTPTTMLG